MEFTTLKSISKLSGNILGILEKQNSITIKLGDKIFEFQSGQDFTVKDITEESTNFIQNCNIPVELEYCPGEDGIDHDLLVIFRKSNGNPIFILGTRETNLLSKYNVLTYIK